MSEDRLHNASDNRDSWLNASFEQWDAGVPADNWEELDEALSVEKVWSRIDQSILADEHAQDSWISESHKSWEPELNTDGWAKLNDAVSIEQVWQELNTTLSIPVSTRVPFVKILAATIAMLFVVGNLNDSPVETTKHAGQPETIAGITTQHYGQTARPSLANGAEIENPADGTPSQDIAGVPSHHVNSNQHTEIALQEVLLPADPSIEQQRQIADQRSVTAPVVLVQQESTDNEIAGIDPLERKALTNRLYFPVTGNWDYKQRFSPWTFQIGTQLSVLQETDQSRLTSVFPKLGMAADLSFRHRVGPVQLIHALGVSQYSQDAGKYVNGRYRNTEQRINTMQWSSSAGYTYRRLTVYGGVLFSKMLNGLEQNQSKVTKVYNFNSIQLGATGGIDIRIVSFGQSGKHISVGGQYQWIPNLSGKNQSFENIHGIRFQAKFSF